MPTNQPTGQNNFRIKVYIVTYKKNDVLNKNLSTLWANATRADDMDVTILANHPDVLIDNENQRENLRIVLNNTRMPHAWGYLSRDWNYCILDAFKTWRNPDDVDWVVLAQNDVTWIAGWDDWIRKNKKFDFVTQPRGDQAMLINIDAVKKIGFFDERFTTIAFQEQDYFTRAAFILKKHASINDDHVGVSSFNEIGCVLSNPTASGCSTDDTLHTMKTYEDSCAFLYAKWQFSASSAQNKWSTLCEEFVSTLISVPDEVNWYPFFWDGMESRPAGIVFPSKELGRIKAAPLKKTKKSICNRILREVARVLPYFIAKKLLK